VTLGLVTLAPVALSQDLFLSSAKSCKLAALAGKWMVKDSSCASGPCTGECEVTLDSKTCELSANISPFGHGGPLGLQLSNFQPVDLSADLLNPLGWRQSGDIAVQGFRATVGTHAGYPFNTTELLGWHDPSTQSLTTFSASARGTGYDGWHDGWLWVPLTKHAGRGAVANHRPSPRAAVSEAMTRRPCDNQWSADSKSLMAYFGEAGGFLVTSTADFPDYNQSDALTFGSGDLTDEGDLCELKFSISPLSKSTRFAKFTNFAEVKLSSKMYQELGLSWAADGAPIMAASMEVSTEHGNGSALAWSMAGVGSFIYCRYDDNSKEIFQLGEAN
jgi:hypothetical protein